MSYFQNYYHSFNIGRINEIHKELGFKINIVKTNKLKEQVDESNKRDEERNKKLSEEIDDIQVIKEALEIIKNKKNFSL